VVRSLAQITRKLETHSFRNYSGGNQAAACDDEASGTIAEYVQRICHDTLPWLISNLP
jgi:hypothetical protein